MTEPAASHETTGRAGRLATWAAVGLFAVLAVAYALMAGRYAAFASAILVPSAAAPVSPDFEIACRTINVCMRVGVPLLGQAVSSLVDAATALLFMKSSTSTLIAESPWGRMDHATATRAMVSMTAAYLAVRVGCLLPLLWLTLAFFRGSVARFFFLLAAFLTLAGWPPPMLDGVYGALRLLADWPLAYFLFSSELASYDFGSIGFICLIALYIARRRRKTLAEIAGLTLLGQLIFENNGIVAGVAFFLDALCDPANGPPAARRRIAFVRLAVAAAVTLAVAAGFAALYATLNPVPPGARAGGALDSILAYARDFWRDYGSNNFRWWNVTLANFLTLTAIPAVVGIVVGAVGARMDAGPSPMIADDLRGALAAAVGFFVTVLIGLFVSGLSSDMGRQLLPLTLMALTASAKIGEALAARARDGRF